MIKRYLKAKFNQKGMAFLFAKSSRLSVVFKQKYMFLAKSS